jgi:hypothetical protein
VDRRSVSSLLPYLDESPGNPLLRISTIAQDLDAPEKTSFPFSVISEPDPLTLLIEAHFATDAGSELKRVFLLVQRDRYPLTSDDLWPINNSEIDQSWQETFSFHKREKQSGSFIVLSHQIDETGGLRPLQSLFFCKKRSIFFPPFCPDCGLPLQQCYDDDLLIRSGLHPYSSSLRRYLFCPSCSSTATPGFYVDELDRSDPLTVKDRRALIKSFALLLESGKQGDPFPCKDCPDQRGCYGADDLVLSRIVPFSFYPFFMLIFEAMTLNALDFLPLLSGATFDEVEARLKARRQFGRINCLKAYQPDFSARVPRLFDGGEKDFLEVFYLKLSFLGEIVQSVSGGDFDKHPDLRLSLERIWVKLPDHGTLLPFFWNFKVGVIGLNKAAQASSFPKLPESYGLQFLGLTWFFTLLVNKKQNIAKVYLSLGEVVDQFLSGGDPLAGGFLKKDFASPFLPENTFWSPEGRGVKKDWVPLWEKGLRLGWSLTKASLKTDLRWSEEEFRQQLEEVREEVKKHLFQERAMEEGRADRPSAVESTAASMTAPMRAPAAPTVAEGGAENEVIHHLLLKILDRWRLGMEAEKKEVQGTVILSTEGSKAEEKELEQTVILSAEALSKQSLSPPSQEKTTKEDMPETVFLFAPGGGAAPGGEPSQRTRPEPRESDKKENIRKDEGKLPEEDDLAETVFLGPERIRDMERKNQKK